MWIFGYGSLLWYQDFPFVKCVSGVVRGCSRRFWQLSPDHRGTPEKPGRTVTMVHDTDQNTVCWGKAFKVPDDAIEETIKYLDFREKAGYVRIPMMFYPDDNVIAPFEVETYMNIDDEVHRTEDTAVTEIARTIFSSVGPSGPNIEYLLKLSTILRKECPVDDPHVFELEELVLKMCKEAGVDHNGHTVGKSRIL